MKNIIAVCLCLLFLHDISFAKLRILSDIPVPFTKVVPSYYYSNNKNLEHLNALLKRGKIFSFLDLYEQLDVSNVSYLDRAYYKHLSILNIKHLGEKIDLKVAVVMPTRIGNYYKSIPTTIINSLINIKIPFKMKVFPIENQKRDNIESILSQVYEQGYRYIILAVTNKGVDSLENLDIPVDAFVYIPTINIMDLKGENNFANNVYFGGISYKNQLEKLIENIQPQKTIIYSDKSEVSAQMFNYLQDKNLNIVSQKIIANKRAYSSRVLDSNIDANSTIFLNTPVVTSSIVLSNLTYYKKEIKRILSTQINYTPSIFNLTQMEDIKSLYIANSIIARSERLEETNILINNDIVYDWVNYATSVGIDFLINQAGYFTKEYDIKISNNQFEYNIEILKPDNNKLVKGVIESDVLIDENANDNNPWGDIDLDNFLIEKK